MNAAYRGERARPRAGLGGIARLSALLRARNDAGFSLVEVAVSIGIVGIVLVILSSMMAVGMRGVLRGKQREVAVQDNGEVLEIARSLAYDNLGLAQADATLGTDVAIVDQGGVKKYLVNATTNHYEPIVWAVNPVSHPFNPHQTTFKRGSTTLTRYVYVTGVDTNGDGAIDYKRVTSRVSWAPNGTSGPVSNDVRAQTFIAESSLTPVNPPGGAGIPPLSGKAVSLAGSGSIRLDRKSSPDSANAVNVTPITFELPSTDATTKVHATSSIECRAEGPSLQGSTQTYGDKAVTVSADDDPTTAASKDPAPQTLSSTDTVAGGDDVDSVVFENAMTYALGCAATANDDDTLPPADDNLPLDQGLGSGPGTLTFSQDLTGAGLLSAVMSVLKLAGPSATQTVDHATSGVRQISSTSAGALGETNVQQITGVIPRGVVRVQAFSYSATAIATGGTPTAPTLSVPSGIFLEVYDPVNAIPAGSCDARSADGYCQKTISPDAPGFSGWSTSVDETQDYNLGLTTIHFTATVNALPPAMTPAGGTPGPNGQTLWKAAYTAVNVTSQLTVTVDVDGLPGGSSFTLTDSIVDLTLGTVNVEGCHGVTCA